MKRYDIEVSCYGGIEPCLEKQGEWVSFEEAIAHATAEYERGYANGSGVEGVYQRTIHDLNNKLTALTLERDGLKRAITEHNTNSPSTCPEIRV